MLAIRFPTVGTEDAVRRIAATGAATGLDLVKIVAQLDTNNAGLLAARDWVVAVLPPRHNPAPLAQADWI